MGERASALAVWAATAALAWAAPVAAQGPFHQDVVVTAAATPVAFGSVTRTVTIITAEQIAQLPVRSIADVLRLTGAVDVRARGVRGIQTDFAVRGAHFGQMLVLVDGVRLNDAQSGHHNGDIPVPLEAVERIEVLHGPGSSLFGADAFGGTINVITRDGAAPPAAVVEGGSFGYLAARGRAGFARGRVAQTFAMSADRSSGFMVERGFATAAVSSRTSLGDRSDVLASYVWKDFGANGFYGNAPSHEWTNQALAAANHRFGTWSGWRLDGTLSYRTHGDHFIWDVRTPSLSENEHRTHATIGALRTSRTFGGGTSVAGGVEAAADWIRSTNLGDHRTARVSGFGEWRRAIGADVQLDASLRVDRYDEFGTSWSPAAGVGWWASPRTRVRASIGRAFRVPTFTERYYSDPAHLARPEIHAETAWAGETGVDLFLASGWNLTATVFGRLEDDVIDWLRPTAADRWRTYNIRQVETMGVELMAGRTLPGGTFVQAGYTGLDVDAGAVTQLSKYVLDYAPHGVVGAAVVPFPAGLRVAPRLEYRHRTRSTGTSDYAVLDVRVSRRFGAYELRVDGTNLFDAEYQEVPGVAMPGAAMTVSIAASVQ